MPVNTQNIVPSLYQAKKTRLTHRVCKKKFILQNNIHIKYTYTHIELSPQNTHKIHIYTYRTVTTKTTLTRLNIH